MHSDCVFICTHKNTTQVCICNVYINLYGSLLFFCWLHVLTNVDVPCTWMNSYCAMSPAQFQKDLIMLCVFVHECTALRSQRGHQVPLELELQVLVNCLEMGTGNWTHLTVEPSPQPYFTVFVNVYYTYTCTVSIKNIEIFYYQVSLGTEAQCICISFCSFIFNF